MLQKLNQPQDSIAFVDTFCLLVELFIWFLLIYITVSFIFIVWQIIGPRYKNETVTGDTVKPPLMVTSPQETPLLQLQLCLHVTGPEPFWTKWDQIGFCLHGPALYTGPFCNWSAMDQNRAKTAPVKSSSNFNLDPFQPCSRRPIWSNHGFMGPVPICNWSHVNRA